MMSREEENEYDTSPALRGKPLKPADWLGLFFLLFFFFSVAAVTVPFTAHIACGRKFSPSPLLNMTIKPKSPARFKLGRQSSLAPESRTPIDTLTEDEDDDLAAAATAGIGDPTIRLMYLANEGDIDGINKMLDSGTMLITVTSMPVLLFTSPLVKDEPMSLSCCLAVVLRLIRRTDGVVRYEFELSLG